MEKTSRQLFLHWVDEKANPENNTEAAVIRHQLNCYCNDLLNEVRHKTETYNNRAELQFYLSKNYQLLLYCSKRIVMYEELATQEQSALYSSLRQIILDTTQKFIDENRLLFPIEEEIFSDIFIRHLISPYYTALKQTAIILKTSGHTSLADLLYRHIIYLMTCSETKGYIFYHTIALIEQLFQSVQQNKIPDEKGAVSLILSLDLHTAIFQRYVEGYIKRMLIHVPKPSATMGKIKQIIKEIQCIQPQFSFTGERLKDYALNLLKLELEYQESFAGATREIATVHQEAMEKIAMDLSVEELAAIIRLFKEQNIIKEQNISKICRQVIHCFKSCRTENIALNSFMKKYYNVERRTIDSLRALLKDMHGNAQHL